jgi:hypothetical protein
MREYSIVFLGLEDWPEWFTLDLVQDLDPTVLPLPIPAPLLVIGFAEEPLQRLVGHIRKYQIPDVYKKRLKEYGIETDFLLDTNKPWGFRGMLNPYYRPGQDGVVEYAIPIPRIERDAGECTYCNDTSEDDDCSFCSGTGRITESDWDDLDCISATLRVLWAVLETPDKTLIAGIKTSRQQLVSVRTNFERGRAFIGATLSRPFGDYLRLHSRERLREVETALKTVYLHMYPRYARFGDSHYAANVGWNGQLILDVPGNACGLYVEGSSSSLREHSGPMELECHNVDGHHQQLTLLCGLAALCGRARKDLYSGI